MNRKLILSITSLAAIWVLASCSSTYADAPITISVSVDGSASVTVGVGTSGQFDLVAAVSGGPVPTSECTATQTTTWSSGAPITGDATEVSFDYDTAGTYTGGDSATADFVSNCGDDQSQPGPVSYTAYVIGGPLTGITSSTNVIYYCDGSAPSYNASAAGGQPSGTSYSWTATGGAAFQNADGSPTQSLSGTQYSSVTMKPTGSGASSVTVSYSLNGTSVSSPAVSFHIRKPSSALIDSDTFSDPTYKSSHIITNPALLGAFGFTGQDLFWKVLDDTGGAMGNVPVQESFDASSAKALTNYLVDGMPWAPPTADVEGWTTGSDGIITSDDPYQMADFGRGTPGGPPNFTMGSETYTGTLPVSVGSVTQHILAGGCSVYTTTLTYATDGAQH